MKKINILLLLCIGLLLAGCTGRLEKVPSGMSEFKEIELLEIGVIRGDTYYMFKDSRTGMRIFYFNHAMVILPPKKKEPVEE